MTQLHHPALALHLTDTLLSPILSTSQSDPHNEQSFIAQTILQATSLTTYVTARKLGLGRPLRVLVETQDKGSVVLHSYLNPPATQRSRTDNVGNGEPQSRSGEGLEDILANTRGALRLLGTDEGHERPSSNGIYTEESGVHEQEQSEASELPSEEIEDDDLEPGESLDEQLSDLLIATVVAPDAAHARDARRAVGKLERIGAEFRKELERRDEEARKAAEGEAFGC